MVTGAKIDVDGADTIDALGDPRDRAQRIDVVDKAVVCVRPRRLVCKPKPSAPRVRSFR
jgi:hypothetical protein